MEKEFERNLIPVDQSVTYCWGGASGGDFLVTVPTGNQASNVYEINIPGNVGYWPAMSFERTADGSVVLRITGNLEFRDLAGVVQAMFELKENQS